MAHRECLQARLPLTEFTRNVRQHQARRMRLAGARGNFFRGRESLRGFQLVLP
jgi:hypothetical protein